VISNSNSQQTKTAINKLAALSRRVIDEETIPCKEYQLELSSGATGNDKVQHNDNADARNEKMYKKDDVRPLTPVDDDDDTSS
jgi:hypothetical protein